MNKAFLSGNLTRDPEVGQTNSGIKYVRFTIAVQRRFANADGKYETDFLNCVAWRNTAEFIGKYFKKGNRINVAGSIQTRSYDGQDGSRRTVTEVVVDEAEFGGKNESNKEEKKEATQAKLTPMDDDGSLPF